MSTKQPNSYRSAFAIVTTLFFLWGFITVLVDALLPRLRDVFELTYFQAGLVQFAFFTAYAVISIPGGYLISKIGYKRGVVVGLVTMSIACVLFYPAAALRVFPLFLLALFVLASGITILQVAANPYVAALGPASTASSRLNLSQAFNSLGTTVAPLVSASFILGSSVMSSAEVSMLDETTRMAYYVAEAAAVQSPFIVLAGVIALVALVFGIIKLPQILESNQDKSGSYKAVMKQKHLMLGAIGIFVYVGAEVSIGSYLVNYFLGMDVSNMVASSTIMSSMVAFLSGNSVSGMNPARVAGTFVFFYWGGAMVGRFAGAYILQFIQPGKLLGSYGAFNITLLIITMLSGGYIAFWSVLAIGLFNSIMFPTIFTLAIAGLNQNTAQGSGVLCTAIVGGAIIPPLFGVMADAYGISSAFIIPIVCYAYIVFYGLVGSKSS